MIGHALIYATDGTVTLVSPLREPVPLEWHQGHVGGYIEAIPGFDSVQLGGLVHRCVAFCNETGKLDGLPINVEATQAWADALGGPPRMTDVLVGPVLVIWGDQELMDEL